MCVAQGNVLGKVIGSDNFAKIDPLAGAVEKFDTEKVAPAWKNMVSPKIDTPKALTYQSTQSPTAAGNRVGGYGTGFGNGTLLTDLKSSNKGATARTTLLGQ